jgi:hypothetical protein
MLGAPHLIEIFSKRAPRELPAFALTDPANTHFELTLRTMQKLARSAERGFLPTMHRVVTGGPWPP